MPLTEATLEEAALTWFGELGYAVLNGGIIAPGEKAAERASFGDVVLVERLREAIARLNPSIPTEGQEEAVRKVLHADVPGLVAINRRFHKFLRDGVEVEYRCDDGTVMGDVVRLVDFDSPGANDWLAVNQFTVIESGHNRRPDIVVFLNGLPVGVIELKVPEEGEEWFDRAYKQIQTYKKEIPSFMAFNEVSIVSDGLQARMGSLTAGKEWFKVWRTLDGTKESSPVALQLETLVKGVFDRVRFLDLLRHFIVFEEDSDSGSLTKILAGYHQFHAVNVAVQETLRATKTVSVVREGGFWSKEQPGGEAGDRRCGVVWHTQGSGKSLTMLFYAGEIILEPEMHNPTLVVLTDRNDLDDQLFGQFLRCHEHLRQMPVQAESREHLRKLLQVASGGVVFTTIQKFMPSGDNESEALSSRSNIVVIADEAHRSQYDFIDGLARHLRDALPNASFIGFTGTPIEKSDANTRAVFGDYISVYDIQRAVEDKATVPIYYESRIAKLGLKDEELPKLDEEIDELTEGQEYTQKEKLKTKWAALEALVGDPKRVQLVAKDLVEHFERRQEAMQGKAMIVCMSRRICVEMYDAIIKLRPDWAGAPDDDAQAEAVKSSVVKVVMTGSAEDGPEWQPHVRNKDKRRVLANRFKDSKDPFRIVIVRDMWLTGFDAPCLHTMYVDKPMRGHGLMQAIARVNRVFRDKPGGLVVDYLGLADQLKKALFVYTDSGGHGAPSVDMEQALAVLHEKYEVCRALFHGFKWDKWTTGTPVEKLQLLPAAQEHILAQPDGKKRLIQAVTELSQAFALCAASDDAKAIRDDVGFFQVVKAAMTKPVRNGKSPEDLDLAVRQLVSQAIVTGGEIIDVFTAAGLKRPDISILSDEFLAEVKGMKHRNLAAELLEKLLKGEVKTLSRRNLVQSQVFSEKLKKTLNAYHNRAIATQEIIEELIRLAKDMRAADQRGIDLGLNNEEVAFYDALAVNDSAVKVMGQDELKVIATELVTKVRQSVTIDWTLRDSARARIRVMVKRILKKHGYPPDLQDEATKTVLKQAELLCKDWTS